MNEEVTHKTNLFKIQVLKGRGQNLTFLCGACHKLGVVLFAFKCQKCFDMAEGSDLFCEV